MKIVLKGVNHETAPVELRERLACQAPQEENQGLKEVAGVHEAAVISTCNRLEVVFTTEDPQAASGRVTEFLCRRHQVTPGEIEASLYVKSGLEAVAHLFRVACGLDSMVLGETQILGQIKDAYQFATLAGTTATILNRLFHKSFAVAKRVRTETGIGTAEVSVAHAAVELALKIFGDLGHKTALLLGAGEMGELTAEHFLSHGGGRIMVVNRSLERGVDLARRYHGQAHSWDELADVLVRADVVICSTGATTAVITPDLVKKAQKARRRRPLFFIDIAVPRDVDPDVGAMSNVFLYDIDDLTQVVDQNLARRQKEAVAARRIVEEEAYAFGKWIDGLALVPTITALTQKADDIRQAELARTMRSFGPLTGEQREALDQMTLALTRKLLHDPIMFIKRDFHKSDPKSDLAFVRRLFNLNGPEDDESG